MKNILVTGASGYIGGKLARALCAEPALNQMRYRWVASPEKFVRKTGFSYQYDSAAAFEDYARSRGR